MDYIRHRVRELLGAGLPVDQQVVARYLLSELTPLSTGLKAKVDPLELDAIDSDIGEGGNE